MEFEGFEQTLSGFHLCNATELVPVTRVVAQPTSSIQRRPCQGWLPWTMCDVTVFKTVFHTEIYFVDKPVRKCCYGYEQVGSYCALSLNRSVVFTSKLGLCPSGGFLLNHSESQCKWDIDCPQWQKCCQAENTTGICSNPVPVIAKRSWCFNVTVSVKISYELVTRERGLFNYSRLLHSVVTGALGNDEFSVHHLWSWSAGLFTTSSSVLVCSSKNFSQEDISIKINQLGNIDEVVNVLVQDVDECQVPEMRSCSPHADCMNTVGSYSCSCHHGFEDHSSGQPGTVCTIPVQDFMNATTTSTSTASMTNLSLPGETSTLGPPLEVPTPTLKNYSSSKPSSGCDKTPEITSIFADDVTASSFRVTWITNTQTGVTFLLVLQNSTYEQTQNVSSSNWTFTDLNPAVLYTVLVSPSVCGLRGNQTKIKVRTGKCNHVFSLHCSYMDSSCLLDFVICLDGLVLGASVRLTNVNYTESMSDPKSDAYKEFCERFINELRIQITSLSSGSIVVNYSIILEPASSLNTSKITNALMVSLQNSSVYSVDPSSVHIEDLNECLLGDVDCSPWANCTNTYGSYTCDCWAGYTSVNPRRPGRICTATSIIPPTSSNHEVTSSTSTLKSSTAANVHSSLSSTGGTTHLLTSTTASTTTTPGSNKLLAIASASNMNRQLRSNITVDCSLEFIKVFIKRKALMLYNISEDSLYLGKPECGQRETNNTHLWLITPLDSCGTTLGDNSTLYSVNVTLYNNWKSSQTRLEIPVICSYSSIIISTGYTPAGRFDVINDPVAGSGQYDISVRLLNGTNPFPENYSLSPEEDVVVEVRVNTSISQIKVLINKCWATSSSNSSLQPGVVFLENGCPVAGEPVEVLQNGNNSVALVSVKIFSIINEDVVFLHCEIQICFNENSCMPRCTHTANSKSSNENFLGVTRSVGPIKRLHTSAFQNNLSNTLQTVGFALLGVAVFLLSLAGIAVLVYYRKKMGNYNFRFRPQQENFTYHFFDT
ncbi:hypothetical protein DNTS_033613 [Danionella cerebrum]|uniref:Uromodulin-like 1 n=1 Tax=Danionella cerebrum TaxID=2873325 RepID=A0A553RC32_9TELE|nr:hypothetical protein DNTS_033613 [Danionella translucida]